MIMNAPTEIRVEEWRTDASRAASVDAEIGMLAEVLHAVVHAGAGISFFAPFSIDEARAFWVDKVLPQVRAATRRVVVARRGDRIVGTVSGSNAELLYRSLDFIAAGVIPRYARGALTPELEGTTIMYKELTPAE